MARYLLVKPHPHQSVVVDADTFVIVLPDDVDPWTYDVPNAGDDTRVQVFGLIEQLEFDEANANAIEPAFPLANRFTVDERCLMPGRAGSYPNHAEDEWGYVVGIERRVETRIVETLVVQFDGEEPRGINPDIIAHGDDWRHKDHDPT